MDVMRLAKGMILMAWLHYPSEDPGICFGTFRLLPCDTFVRGRRREGGEDNRAVAFRPHVAAAHQQGN